jgi:hypothetical protein
MARPRLQDRNLIEAYYRVPVRELFLKSSGVPGRPETEVVAGVPIKYWTRADEHGVIEAHGKSWFVQYQPRSQWRNEYGEFCASYYVHSSTGERHRFLLVAEDSSQIGTRSEIQIRYYSERRQRTPHRIQKRAKIIRELMLNTKPDDLTLKYVAMPPKPKGRHLRSWERKVRRRIGWRYVVVRKPYLMYSVRFEKLLRELNRHHEKEASPSF